MVRDVIGCESIKYYEQPIEHSPVRVSQKQGYASGYVMPYEVPQVEKVFK